MRYWIKLYTEILQDEKMGELDDASWRRAIELFLLAGMKYEDGRLPPLKTIAWHLHIPQANLERQLQPLLDAGILTKQEDGSLLITNFVKRQEPDPHAERSQRYYDRKRRSGSSHDGDDATQTRRERDEKSRDDATQTRRERDETSREREKESEKESERESEDKSLSSLLSSEFTEATGITVHDSARWNTSIRHLIKLGAKPGDIKTCIGEISGRYNISGPWSIKQSLGSVITRRERGNGSGGKSGPTIQNQRIVTPEDWRP
jgi:hypothetical protein